MKKFQHFLKIPTATGSKQAGLSPDHQAHTGDRDYWLKTLSLLAEPILTNLSLHRLKKSMPLRCRRAERRKYSHLEAFGRLLAGIAPWLELVETSTGEDALRRKYADLARQSLRSATDPKSPDYMNFSTGYQPLVDTAFLAQAIIRAPNELWSKLSPEVRTNVVTAFKSTRVIKPYYSNWLLFSAIVEAALCLVGEQWDIDPVDYALRKHEEWYKGDGTYGDGPNFRWDYYNSFVIHPFLVDMTRTIAKVSQAFHKTYDTIMERAVRYAAIQERIISPEGSFPAIGRSLAYRFGAFHLLGQMALMHQLPKGVSPSQVRCALTTVIRRMVEAPGTFDRNGWLTIGFCGRQPGIGEHYISTGSLYLCAVGLLPLGLPPDDKFWTDPPEDWTSRKIWSGKNVDADHAL